jgi:hypothetical protein
MSNIFLKNELSNIFDTITESNVSLPKWITIVEKANQTEDKTSSAFVQQGGNFSATSANSSTAQDVNKLISMLTSESSSAANALSQTSTESLEEQLRSILNQDGGAKNKYKSKKQKGGNDEVKVDDVKKFFTNLKSQGVNVDVKLNNQTMSDFFGLAQNTTTDMSKLSEVSSSTSSINIQNIIGTDNQSGGAKKKKGSKKASKKGSKKSMDGGVNPGFQAFLDLKKHVAEKLGISNGPAAAKVAGAVQKDMKEKHPDKDAVTIAKEGMKHFDANMAHYKQMLPSK